MALSGLRAFGERMADPFMACKLGPLSCVCVQQGRQPAEHRITNSRRGCAEALPDNLVQLQVSKGKEVPGSEGQAFARAPDSGQSSSSAKDRRVPLRPKLENTCSDACAGESLDWINEIVSAVWPKASEAVCHLVQTELMTKVKEQLPTVLKGLSVSEFTLGSNTPKFSSIRVFEIKNLDGTRRGIEIELSMRLESDLDIELSFKTGGMQLATLGIKKLTIAGSLAVRLEPLLDEQPIVGGIIAFFYDPPTVDLGFTGLGSFTQHPTIAALIRGQIDKAITTQMVLPNVLSFQLGTEEQGVDLAHLRRPSPLGVLRVTALQGRGLKAADWHLFSAATSDPYISMTLADETWKSAAVKATCDPDWPKDTSHDFLIYDHEQRIKLDVYDEDLGTCKNMVGQVGTSFLKSDDKIGRAESMTVSEALELSEKDIPLFDPDVPWDGHKAPHHAGHVRLRMEWLSLEPRNWKQDALCLVDVKVDEVYMPASMGHAAGLRASIEGKTEESKVHNQDLQEAIFAIKRAREQVAARCLKRGTKVDDVAWITSLPENEVRAVAKGETFVKGDISGTLSDDVPFALPLEYVLRFVLPTSGLDRGVADLVLFGEKGETLGEAQVDLVGAYTVEVGDGSRYQYRDTRSGKASQIGKKMARVLFRNAMTGKTLEAEISIYIYGLAKGKAVTQKVSLLSGAKAQIVGINAVPKQPKCLDSSCSLDWLNKVLLELWPYIDKHVAHVVKTDVQREVNLNTPVKVKIEACSLGETPPTLGPIRVQMGPDGDSVEIQLGLTLTSEIELKVSTPMCNLGLERIYFSGAICVRIVPLLNRVPVIGGVVIYFLDPPQIDFKFSGAAKIAEHFSLMDVIKHQLKYAVVKSLVLPNVFSIPFGSKHGGIDLARLNCPTPIGGLRVTVLRGRDLIAADIHLLSNNASDPYVKINFSDTCWHSAVVNATCNPVWKDGQVSQFFLVYDMDQGLMIDVFDHDLLSDDDHIGHAKNITVKEALDLSETEIQLYDPNADTKDKAAGFLTLRFQWVNIMKEKPKLGPIESIVEVKIGEVHLPAVLGSVVSLAATVLKDGTHVRKTTPEIQPPPTAAKNTHGAVQVAFDQIVDRLSQKGFSVDEIEAVTQKDKAEIDAELASELEVSMTPTPSQKFREASALEHTIHKLELERVLRWVVPTAQVMLPDAVVKLELLGGKKAKLGEATVKLADVLAKKPSGEVIFKGPGGRIIRAQISVNISGFAHVEGDEVGGFVQANWRSALSERLKCFKGVCARL